MFDRKRLINGKVARMMAAMSPTKTYTAYYRAGGSLIYRVSAILLRAPEGGVSYIYGVERILSEAERADRIRSAPAWDWDGPTPGEAL